MCEALFFTFARFRSYVLVSWCVLNELLFWLSFTVLGWVLFGM